MDQNNSILSINYKPIFVIAILAASAIFLLGLSSPVRAGSGGYGTGTLYIYSGSGCTGLLPQSGGIKGYVLPATGTYVYIQIKGITESGIAAISVQFTPNKITLSATVSSGSTNCIPWQVGNFGGDNTDVQLACGQTGVVFYGPASTPAEYKTLSNGGSDGGHMIGSYGCTSTQGASSISTTVVDDGPGHFIAGVSPPEGFLGDSFHDTATLTVSGDSADAPTGTVTYYFYTTGDCSGDATTSTGAVGGTAASPTVGNSASTGPLLAGSYSFQAVYSGDSNYAGSTGDCEPFTVSSTPFPPPPTVPQFPFGLAVMFALLVPALLLLRKKIVPLR